MTTNMLRFEAETGGAVDPVSGVRIYKPRALPGAKPGEVEYQYSMRRGDDTNGLGCNGLFKVVQIAGEETNLSTIDLTPSWVLDGIFRIKRWIGFDGHDFDFISQLANGLVLAFQTPRESSGSARYVVLGTQESLHLKNIEVPAGLERLANEYLILAELSLPASPTAG